HTTNEKPAGSSPAGSCISGQSEDPSTSVVIPNRQPLVDAKVLGAGLAAHRVLLRFERDLLTFVERAQTCAFNGADVDENVGAAIIGLDEAKPLGRFDPLNVSGSHVPISKMRESALPTRPPRSLIRFQRCLGD